MDCYVVQVCHTQRRDPYITVLRQAEAGYCWSLCRAARMASDTVLENPGRYNAGHDVAVPCTVLDALAVEPMPGQRRGLHGPCVPNTRQSWAAILSAAVASPQRQPRPKFSHSRRGA